MKISEIITFCASVAGSSAPISRLNCWQLVLEENTVKMVWLP